MVELFIFDLVERGLTWLLGDTGRAMMVLVLAVAALYFRRALGLGTVLASWIGRIAFVLVVLAILLAIGVIPTLDVGALFGVVETVIELGKAVWEVVT